MRKKLFHLTFVILAFIITGSAIATGSYFGAGYQMAIGSISELRIRAPFSIIDEAATAENRAAALERANNLLPVFAPDPAQWGFVSHNLNVLQERLEEIRLAYRQEQEDFAIAHAEWEVFIEEFEQAAEEVRELWRQQAEIAVENDTELPPEPTIPDPPPEPEFQGESLLLFAALPFTFSEAQQQLIIDLNGYAFDEFWERLETVAYLVQTQEVIHERDFVTERIIQRALEAHEPDRSLALLSEDIIFSNLMPNAIPNVEENQRNFDRTADDYVRVMIQADSIIIDEGEVVTAEIYDILLSLGLLAPDSLVDSLYEMLGVFFIAAVLFALSIMYISFYRPNIVVNTKEAALLLTLYILTLALVWTLRDFAYPFLPLLIFPMLVSILVDRRLSTVLTFSLVLICYFIVDGDLTYLLFYSVSGLLICMLSRFTTERNKVILVGFLVLVIQFALSVAVAFIIDHSLVFEDLTGALITAGFASLIGFLTVFLCMGSLPLWETLFGVVTPVKLLDLTNPTNLLLRRLTIEAPGTYHHSLIVANLAETAAYDIGANAHAARVGGYYHDVGKLKMPHYFVENLDGENPHDHLEPLNSVQLIMSHVSYGLTLAGEHRLPQFVRDIIKEHHGTTLMQYFYSKAKELDADVDEAVFRYPYVIPQSKESACVMLADSVEAAVRSMIPKLKSLDEVEKTIRFIIRGKLNDGQLADSKLSIRDVSVIEQSFFRVLKGMYHERIAYPTAKAAAKAAPGGGESDALVVNR